MELRRRSTILNLLPILCYSVECCFSCYLFHSKLSLFPFTEFSYSTFNFLKVFLAKYPPSGLGYDLVKSFIAVISSILMPFAFSIYLNRYFLVRKNLPRCYALYLLESR